MLCGKLFIQFKVLRVVAALQRIRLLKIYWNIENTVGHSFQGKAPKQHGLFLSHLCDPSFFYFHKYPCQLLKWRESGLINHILGEVAHMNLFWVETTSGISNAKLGVFGKNK